MNTRLEPEELKRRYKLFLEWSSPFLNQKAMIMEKCFKGYRIVNGLVVETIYAEAGKQAINDIDTHIEAKAKELGLTSGL